MPSSDPLITLPDQQASRLKVPFGRLATKIVAPSESLDRGLACGCVCPGCGSELVLKQGKRRRFFAHHNAPGSDRCVESAIHAAAKQVLIEHRALVVPEVAFELSATTVTGQLLREVEVLSSQRWIDTHGAPEQRTFHDPNHISEEMRNFYVEGWPYQVVRRIGGIFNGMANQADVFKRTKIDLQAEMTMHKTEQGWQEVD